MLGSVQQNPTYAAQYSFGGGNVLIRAQRDIKHQTQAGGLLVDDSQKQIPSNWLYRRGYVDSSTGQFGVTRDGDIASTTWWVDFSNFFQGVGALGGGHVNLSAGNDISNVDAVAPTNARMTYRTAGGDLQASNQSLLELGGGDLTLRAGNNINAGIFYVERGRGELTAGNQIITNRTRTASLGSLGTGSPSDYDPSADQWLPTTLFLGKGVFRVQGGRDVLLGPVVNAFLQPIGINNSFWRKSYFSTFSSESEVNVTSLGGSVTLRQNSTAPGAADDVPILENWMRSIHVLSSNPRSVSFQQPWLRLGENRVEPFRSVFTVLPGTVRATSFSGSINLVGQFNLSPAPRGTIELAAAGNINGLRPTGVTTLQNTGPLPQTIWRAATINLSDATAVAIPGINAPYGYQARAGTVASSAAQTAVGFLQFIENLFAESGSSTGRQAVVQTQQALHGNSLSRAADREPARIYSTGGSISGLTFFSGKSARVVASVDISDVGLYLQNTSEVDVSVVSSGRDIVAYSADTPLQAAA